MDNPISNDQTQHIRGVIESILFVNEKPVTLDQLKKLLDTVSTSEIKSVLEAMIQDYDTRQSGMRIVEIAGGYQMLSNGIYATYIREFYKTKHTERLSKPALETLAIIAYKQPVTRADIEEIRGVNSDGVVTHLLDKELIKAVGRKDVPGKPFLYGTTKQFLEYFGLKSLQDLPRLEEFPKLVPVQEQPAMIPLEQGEESKATSETAHPQEAVATESAVDTNVSSKTAEEAALQE
jgi:segregation and condensation protein B